MANSGIDYGFGQTNIDFSNGIRYGVIPVNNLGEGSWDTIVSDGVDVDYEETIENIKYQLSAAIKSVLEDYSTSFDAKEIAESIVYDLEFEHESTGDCVRYSYKDDAVEFHTTSDGSIFVTKSKYYALTSFCSPCAPGAGDLTSEGVLMTYCLGPDWFDEHNPMPYECFAVN